MIVEVFFRWF